MSMEKKLWKQPFTLEGLNQIRSATLLETLGIQFTAFGDDFIQATLPVDNRTVQPFRILHGGATAALAETLGSIASQFCLEDPNNYHAVGTELNISHLRSAHEGKVTGTVKAVKIGRRIHVWEIRIHDDKDKLISLSRLTVNIIEARD